MTAQQDKYIGNNHLQNHSLSIYYMAAVTSGRMAVTTQQDKYIINNQCPCYMAAVTSGRMAVTAQQDKYIGNNHQCPHGCSNII